jgi:hypothetical protein
VEPGLALALMVVGDSPHCPFERLMEKRLNPAEGALPGRGLELPGLGLEIHSIELEGVLPDRRIASGEYVIQNTTDRLPGIAIGSGESWKIWLE